MRKQEGTKVIVQVCDGRGRNDGPHISIWSNDHECDLLRINSKFLIPVSALVACHVGIIKKYSMTSP